MKLRIHLIVLVITLTAFINPLPGMAMQAASAVTYYVSSSTGSDSYNGLSEGTPFATVSTVNTLNLQPGDQVLFKCGDSWHADPLYVRKSGLAGSPITFSSYPAGCANRPIFSGAQPIFGWTQFSTNIFVASLDAGANAGKFTLGINQLFRDNTRLLLGRWPNLGAGDGGYATIDSFPAANAVTDNQLPGINWNGAVAHIRGMRWYILNRQVTGTNTANRTLTLGANVDCWDGCTGWGYFLNNHLATLDVDGEWYYDASTHKVYLYSGTGAPTDGQIEGSVILKNDDRSWGGINLGEDLTGQGIAYVTVDNLDVRRWFRSGIALPTNFAHYEPHQLVIQNSTISDVDSMGIDLATWVYEAWDGRPDGWRGGYGMTVSGNTITRANSMGINLYSRNSTFSGNVIREVGLIKNLGTAGMGCAFDAGEGACTEDGDGLRIKIDQVDDSGNTNFVADNRLEQIAHNGMDIFGHHNVFERNVIVQACYAKGDCGGVRTFGRDNLGSTPVHDLVFNSNIIMDTIGNTDGCKAAYDPQFGFGLYIDNFSRDINVTGNTLINSTSHGILFQNSTGSATNNTLYNNATVDGAQIYVGSAPASLSAQTGNVLYNLNPNPDAWTLVLKNPSGLGTSNHNYFFSPYKANHIWASGEKSLAQWQSFSGKDSASVGHWFTLSPGTPTNSRIFYNDTGQAQTFNLGSTIYKDLTQNLVWGSLEIQPYQSKVLVSPLHTISDFDGDGKTDVSIFRPSIGMWYVKDQFAQQYGGASDIPVSGDYNGDGKTEAAVFRPSNGVWYLPGGTSVQYGGAGDIPVPGDYDGNGTTDVAVFRPTNGVWYVNGQFAVQYGGAGDIPVPGDYNGDGKTDVAVFRPSNGVWYVNGQFNQQWGGAGDIPVPGDYNGDGMTNVAIWRPSNGMWYVNGQFSQQWGGTGDVPVPGDYNGDGMTNVAIWRPSNGMWYVNGQFSAQYGGAGDFPVPARDTNGDGDPYQSQE